MRYDARMSHDTHEPDTAHIQMSRGTHVYDYFAQPVVHHKMMRCALSAHMDESWHTHEHDMAHVQFVKAHVQMSQGTHVYDYLAQTAVHHKMMRLQQLHQLHGKRREFARVARCHMRQQRCCIH